MTSLSPWQAFVKRLFDVALSSFLILIFFPIILVLIFFASLDTRSFGLFFHERVGQYGKVFLIFKIKTMRDASGVDCSIASLNSERITWFGGLCRKLKIDELPQLFNILFGSMSFVGPRPDVVGYADKLVGAQRDFLNVRPGITGPGSIKYRDEEKILSKVNDPRSYNDLVIWPDKVNINISYIRDWSFSRDIRYLIETLFR